MKVQFKKKEGDLYLGNKSVDFKSPGLAFSIPFKDIKTQHVNVPGPSGKVLLKLSLSNGDNHTFSFTGPDKINERDETKDKLAVELAKVPPSVPTTPKSIIGLTTADIQARQALLTKIPELRNIHKELVMGNIINEEDFWLNRKDMLQNQLWLNNQKRGTASAALADIKPSSDADGSDLKYTLNPEIIHSIFIQQPGVHEAYKDYVPEKVNLIYLDERKRILDGILFK